MIDKFLKNIHYTQKDKLTDEIQHEQEMLSRLHVCLGLAQTPVDLETIFHEIDIHERRLKTLQETLKSLNH